MSCWRERKISIFPQQKIISSQTCSYWMNRDMCRLSSKIRRGVGSRLWPVPSWFCLTVNNFKLWEMIPVFLTAFLHHLRYQEFIRILRIKERFNWPKLFGNMSRIFLFHTEYSCAVSLFRNNGFPSPDWRFSFFQNGGTPAQEYSFVWQSTADEWYTKSVYWGKWV